MRLIEEGYDFTLERTFPDLVCIQPLRFDFCMPSLHILIEVQGRQHFTEGFRGMTSGISLEEIQRRDTLKNSYARKNGWDLIWVSSLGDVGDAISYMKGLRFSGGECHSEWHSDLLDDYGWRALSHYDGNAPRFCWLHRGHFPYEHAGMKLKRLHKSYWDSSVGKGKSPRATWETGKSLSLIHI